MIILRQRSEFLKAAKARRKGMSSVHLQARKRGTGEALIEGQDAIRVGFTCSKKVGNAVARNHAKRRLREAARQELPSHGRPGWDYVLIGRREVTANTPFDILCDELRCALKAVH